MYKFIIVKNGIYIICFSNVFEFLIGENFVYFDLIKGDEDYMGYEGVDGM